MKYTLAIFLLQFSLPLCAKNNFLNIEQAKTVYSEKIKSILQGKCYDCHTLKTKSEEYKTLQGFKQIVDNDIDDALKNIDISQDFPFGGEKSPVEQLKAFKKIIKKDNMPPTEYRMFKPSTTLSDEEKKIILTWAEGK